MFMSLGCEFMPPLDEGSLLYMPVTLPNVSITEAKRLIQVQDTIIKSVPEVEHVLGKVGRAETSTDPAPVSMFESIIILKPKDQWRPGIKKADIVAELDCQAAADRRPQRLDPADHQPHQHALHRGAHRPGGQDLRQ